MRAASTAAVPAGPSLPTNSRADAGTVRLGKRYVARPLLSDTLKRRVEPVRSSPDGWLVRIDMEITPGTDPIFEQPLSPIYAARSDPGAAAGPRAG